MSMVQVGFQNFVNENRIIAVVTPETAPIRRRIQQAKDNGMAIDATCGRKVRSVIYMDSGHIVLSAIQMGRVAERCDEE